MNAGVLLCWSLLTALSPNTHSGQEGKNEKSIEDLQTEVGALHREYDSRLAIMQGRVELAEKTFDHATSEAREHFRVVTYVASGFGLLGLLFGFFQLRLQYRADERARELVAWTMERLRDAPQKQKQRLLRPIVQRSTELLKKYPADKAIIRDHALTECRRIREKVEALELLQVEDAELGPSPLLVAAIALHRDEEYEEASEYLHRCIEMSVGQQADHKKAKRRAYYWLGVQQYNFGKYDNAIRYFDEALALGAGVHDMEIARIRAEARFFKDLADEQEDAFTALRELCTTAEDRLQGTLSAGERRDTEDQLRRCRLTLGNACLSLQICNPSLSRQQARNLSREARTLFEKAQSGLDYRADLGWADSVFLAATPDRQEVDERQLRTVYERVTQAVERELRQENPREGRLRVQLALTAAHASVQGGNPTYLEYVAWGRDELGKLGGQPDMTVFSPWFRKNRSQDEVRKELEGLRDRPGERKLGRHQSVAAGRKTT